MLQRSETFYAALGNGTGQGQAGTFERDFFAARRAVLMFHF
jgi:hypothetical protein